MYLPSDFCTKLVIKKAVRALFFTSDIRSLLTDILACNRDTFFGSFIFLKAINIFVILFRLKLVVIGEISATINFSTSSGCKKY